MQRNTFTLLQANSPVGRGRRLPNFFKAIGALMLVLIGTSQVAWSQVASVTDDVITLTTQPTGQSAQAGRNFTGSDNNGLYSNPTPLGQSSDNSIAVPQLGTYDLNNNSVLTITGAQMQGNLNSGSTTISATRLQYRVYLTGTADAAKPSYTNTTLNSSQSGNTNGSVYNGSNTNLSINVLSGLTSGGTYVLDVRFQVDATRGTSMRTYSDLSGGDYFLANFYITPPPTTPAGGTTTWQGRARGTTTGGTTTVLASDRDWQNTANWTNGVPTAQSDAIIPEKSAADIVYPLLNDPNANYSVRNLTLQGAQGNTASQLTVATATLRIFGNFSQETDPGLLATTIGSPGVTDPTQNSTIIFAGGDQTITGNIVVADLIVAGTGTKSVLTPVTVSNILAFEPTSTTDGVIIQSALQRTGSNQIETVFTTNGRSYVQLLATAQISTAANQAETNVAYIKGVARADRQVTTGVQNTFGNIGLDVTSNHDIATLVVYRVVGSALSGPVSSTAVPIKRYYQISGDDNSNNTSTAASRVDVVFHYLNSGTGTTANELNGINEDNLTMFRTVNNGAPYQALGGTLNKANRTVTRLAIASLANYTLTLGDRTNPLPVSLVAFNAVRSGDKALLTWTTATEEDNKGFNVQVSTDGVKFRNLAFVGSTSPNSVQTQNYSYTDTESNKVGTRYYRLEQVDYSGKTTYSIARAVSFNGAAATSLAIAASPNPFTDQVSLLLEGISTTDGPVSVRIVDMTGRLVREQQLTMSGASIALGNLSELRSGLYLAKVTLPDGTTKTVRVQRQ